MARFLNVVLFNPTAGGTTDFTVSAAVQGYMTPNAAGAANGAVYRYRAENATLTEWEVGYGTYNTGTGVLTRTVVLYNSLGTTAKINFTAAPNVGMGMPLASDIFPFISDTPPTDPDDGALWWESDTGVLYIYYNDGSSKQWVGIQSQSNIAAVLFTAQSLTAAQQLQARNNIGAYDHVECGLFEYVSATSCRFRAKRGNKIKIGGVIYDIAANPATGVTISNGGLSANTLYFCYAYISGGVPTLEFSATGHAMDVSGTNNTGVEIKSGDASRTLVGMIRTNGSSQFVDSATQKFVASWFNRRPRGMNKLMGTYSTTSGSFVEYGAGAERLEFLTWGDTDVRLGHMLPLDVADNGSVASTSYTSLHIDGASQDTGYYYSGTIGNFFMTGAHHYAGELAEGYHYTYMAFLSATAGHTTFGIGGPKLTASVFI